MLARLPTVSVPMLPCLMHVLLGMSACACGCFVVIPGAPARPDVLPTHTRACRALCS